MLVLVAICWRYSASFLPSPVPFSSERREECASLSSREILKSAVRDSVGDPDDLVYARRPSLIMLLPEILSARRWDLGLGIGDWDRQILPACYCSGIFRASILCCVWRDDGSGPGRTRTGPCKQSCTSTSNSDGPRLCQSLFQFGFGLCLFFEF